MLVLELQSLVIELRSLVLERQNPVQLFEVQYVNF